MSREIKKLAVVGTGNLGARIALQAAYYGYQVSAWDPNPASFDHSMGMSEQRVKMTERTPASPGPSWAKRRRRWPAAPPWSRLSRGRTW